MAAHRPARSTLATATLSALLLVVLGVLAATPAAAATGTYVRLAQLTPDMPGSELIVLPVGSPDGGVTIPAVGYGELSQYQRIEPGDYVIGVRPVGSDAAPVVSATLDATPGSAHTLAVVGAKNELGLTVFVDDLTPPEAGQARVRVIDAHPAPLLDVSAPSGEPFADGLACGEASDYRSVPAGAVALGVGPPGGTASELPVTLGANQVVTVVLVDSGGAVATMVSVDAEGPADMPPGPMNAGFGGIADDRSTGVIVFAVLAVAAAALSVRLARSRRGSC